MLSKIVIVEDERIVALNLKQRLIKLGYDIPAMAVSSTQAINAVEASNPDIVLMDIHIEGDMDGVDTAKLLMEKYRTPVIYLTAYSEDSTLDRAKSTKPYGYLLKPFSERELHATIQMALERREYEAKLFKNEHRLRLALSAANMGEWELTGGATKPQMLYAGQADTIFGYAENTFFDTRERFIELVVEEDRPRVNAAIDNSLSENATLYVEFRGCTQDMSQRWLRLQGKTLGHVNKDVQVIGVIQDINERKIIETKLKQASMVFDATCDGILIMTFSGSVLTCNQSFTQITGYTLTDLKGSNPALFQKGREQWTKSTFLKNILRLGNQWRGELDITRKNGESFPALATLVTVKDQHGESSHIILVITDFSAVRNAENKLKYLAHHDPLTELPNRLLTLERLNHAILRGKRHFERVAVLFIDLDNFKWINDSLGHSAGDRLLKVVAANIKACLRADDTIGRLGGDEFLVILDSVEHLESIALVAEKLLNIISRPLILDERTVEISGSIGISVFPDDGRTGEDLVRAADTAMYAAKDAGRNQCEFFTDSMMEKARKYLALNHDLHRGFNAGELALYYQPQVSLKTNRICTLEVLLRWLHPERGLLPASEVIPIAEDCGMIVEIGKWVLMESCKQLARWHEMGIDDVKLAVNVSALQIHKSNFVDTIKTAFTKNSLTFDSCEIEITESTLQHEEKCISVLEELKSLGIGVAIDDFGTGYSCLSSLKLLPIKKLKIDRSFVKDLSEGSNDLAMVEAIIAMAHKLKLTVVAEGVENLEQEELLKRCHCDIIQGYLRYRPLPLDKMTDILREHGGCS